MKTDIDRLHKVALGEVKGRGCGKTFLKCHELAGLVETGFEGTMALVVPYMRYFKHIYPMMVEVFKEHSIKLRVTRQHTLEGNGFKFVFISLDGKRFDENFYKIKGYKYYNLIAEKIYDTYYE